MKRCTKRGTHSDRIHNRFRLIRLFTVDHNIRRLKAYVRELGRLPASVALRRKTRLKRRVRAGFVRGRA